MYFLTVKGNFSAALYLANCKDKHRGMHGHDFRVSLTLASETLNRAGMVYDYGVVKDCLDSISSSLDHILLNDNSEFIEKNPTVENIAKFFYEKLTSKLDDLPVHEVKVSQFKGFTASYRPVVNG